MNWIIGILGTLIVASSIVITIRLEGKRKLSTSLAIAGVLMFMLAFSFTIIPTGHTGVRITFDQISQKTLSSGFTFKIPFVQGVRLIDNRMRDKSFKDEIWGETIDKTPVYASDVIVTYQVNKNKSAWICANVSDSNNLVDSSMIASAAKSAMIKLDTVNVTNRSIIEPLVKDKLNASLGEKYGENTVLVLKVVINNMDFEDNYNAAIEAKSIAQQIQEQARIDNQTAIEKAEADKKVAITNAEAEAEQILIVAQAQADANKIIADSITDGVLRSKFYDKWNGQLPSVMSNDATITSMEIK